MIVLTIEQEIRVNIFFLNRRFRNEFRFFPKDARFDNDTRFVTITKPSKMDLTTRKRRECAMGWAVSAKMTYHFTVLFSFE